MNNIERSVETATRLHAEIMRERAEGLHESALAARDRMVKREEALSRLRAQVAALKVSLNPVPAPAVPQRIAVPVPEKEATMDSASFTMASLPRTWDMWALLPYAMIAVFALILEFRPESVPFSAPDYGTFAQPVAGTVAGGKTVAKGAPVLSDDDRSQEAMLLVHEWTLPGDSKTLGERLGGELELPGGRPMWNVERTGSRGYRVTYQAAEKDVPYAFEADVESRVVFPTPETQELLAPQFTAALRDAVR